MPDQGGAARRTWLALLMAASLAACSQPEAANSELTGPPPGLDARFYPPPGWTWGRVHVAGQPDARYGLAAPPVAPRGDVLVLVDRGDIAETWFETARALMAEGLAVWTLEPPGEAGSQRYALAGRRAHRPSNAPALAAIDVLARRIVRPTPRRPLVVLAEGEAGLLARVAAQRSPISAVLAGAPAIRPEAPLGLVAVWAGRLGLDWTPCPAPDHAPPVAGDPERLRVQAVWLKRRPELATLGETCGLQAAERALAHVEAPAPTLAFDPSAGDRPHLARDAVRGSWLAQVDAALDRAAPRFGDRPRLGPDQAFRTTP